MNDTNFTSKKLKGRDVFAAPWINNYNQNERSLLPICEACAPLFLSAVYKEKYTSEKMTSRCPQSGRSMIEMLGVLAIIGVLSVGGIAGYSKAMMRYRINKTIEQVTLIAGNVRAFFGPQGNYMGLTTENSTGKKIIKKAKLIPDEMLTLDSSGNITAITGAFGGKVDLSHIYSTDDSEEIHKAFYIDYYINDNTEACIELLTQDWSAINVSFIGAEELGQELYAVYSANLPITIDKATEACSDAVLSSRISFYFDANVDFFKEWYSWATWY